MNLVKLLFAISRALSSNLEQQYQQDFQQNLQGQAMIQTDKVQQAMIKYLEEVVVIIVDSHRKGRSKTNCNLCKLGIKMIHYLSKYETRNVLIKIIDFGCNKLIGYSSSICTGMASTFNLILNVASKTKAPIEDFLCFALDGICPYPKHAFKQLPLPPVAKNVTKVHNQEGTLNILQLSDLHLDLHYKEKSEADCNKPVCCQVSSNSDVQNKIKRPAGKWGDYNCDLSMTLLHSMLGHIKKLEVDVILFSGDLIAHDVWDQDYHKIKSNNEIVINHLNAYFPTTTILPVIGNHESSPVNSFPVDNPNFIYYRLMGELWKNNLDDAHILKSINEKGQYAYVKDNLKYISINTNNCHIVNFYLLLDPLNNDPNGSLKWLINELHQAETINQKVIIQGHIPPTDNGCYPNWSRQYLDIIDRFQASIVAQFFGHTHRDQFSLFYKPNKPKIQSNLIAHAYIAPSMTTFKYNNPGFRVYKIDKSSNKISDYDQYFADMKKINKEPEWKLLYSAKKQYFGNSKYLSSDLFHTLATNFKTNNTLFNTYFQLRSKNSGLDNYGKKSSWNNKTRSTILCNIFASESINNCDYYNPLED